MVVSNNTAYAWLNLSFYTIEQSCFFKRQIVLAIIFITQAIDFFSKNCQMLIKNRNAVTF